MASVTKDYTVLRQDSIPSNFYTKLMPGSSKQVKITENNDPQIYPNYDNNIKQNMKNSDKAAMHAYDNNLHKGSSTEKNISTGKNLPAQTTSEKRFDNLNIQVTSQDNIPMDKDVGKINPNYHKYLEIIPEDMDVVKKSPQVPKRKYVKNNESALQTKQSIINIPGESKSDKAKNIDKLLSKDPPPSEGSKQHVSSNNKTNQKQPDVFINNNSKQQIKINQKGNENKHTTRQNNQGRTNRNRRPDVNNNHIHRGNRQIIIPDPELGVNYLDKSSQLSKKQRIILITSIVCLFVVIFVVAGIIAFVFLTKPEETVSNQGGNNSGNQGNVGTGNYGGNSNNNSGGGGSNG